MTVEVGVKLSGSHLLLETTTKWDSKKILAFLQIPPCLVCLKGLDSLSVWTVGTWINDLSLSQQASVMNTINLSFSAFPLSRNPSVSLTCCRSSSVSLFPHPPDPPSDRPLPDADGHARTHRRVGALAHTDPCSDPHPSCSLSLLYLYISTSIGYTCNLATEQSEDPPIPAHSFDCWT